MDLRRLRIQTRPPDDFALSFDTDFIMSDGINCFALIIFGQHVIYNNLKDFEYN
jgi:hypothetical protein